MERLEKFLNDAGSKKKKNTIHTSRHALAEEIAQYFNELKNYGKYLGICHRYPENKVRQIFAEIKEESKRNFEFSPVKVFFWKLKQTEKISKPKKSVKK